MTVHVDGNERMVMHHMVGFYWTYEQEQEREVTDSEGNTTTERSWSPFAPTVVVCRSCFDGTGGIKVNMTSFKRTEYGQMPAMERASAESLGKQLMAQATASMFRHQRTGHRWTIYGSAWAMVYLLGATKRDLL